MPNEFKVKNGLIVDQGGANITGSSFISGALAINSSGSSVFTVDGTSGRLFSVDDSLSGSLFSVNTVAGLPVMEAFSDNTVRIGQYGKQVLFVSQSKVGVGKESALNGTLDVSGSVSITGSMSVSSGITGSLFGSASYALTASYALNAGGASIDTGSFATTGSNVFRGNQVVTGSLTLSSSAEIELTVIGNQINTGSITATQGFTGSLFGTASWANNATTASYILNAVSSSFASTASSADNFTVRGTLTAQTIVAQTITSSTDFVTGSTRFGSLSTNTHQFTGSVSITGSLTLPYLSTGSVLFAGATDDIAEDNTNFFWDNTNKRLGIGTNAPSVGIEYKSNVTDAWVRMTRGANNYHAGFLISPNGAWSNTNLLWNVGLVANTNSYAVWGYNNSADKYFQLIFGDTGNLWVGNQSTIPLDAGYRFDVSGSTRVSGNTQITGSLIVTQGITGSLFGTSSWATNAITASYISASNIAGLSLSQISLGAVTASITAGSNIFNIISGSNTLVVVDNTGSVGIGTTSPAYKLDVNGTARVSGAITTVATVTIGTQLYVDLIRPKTNTTELAILTAMNTTYGVSFWQSYNDADDRTSGTRSLIRAGITFNPTSGTAVRNQLLIDPIINQTGGASGISRGIYLNPTLTAAADWRAIESSTGGAYFNTTSVAASAILQADSTSKGFLPPRMTAAQRIAISSPARGLLVYDIDLITEGLWLYNSGSTPGWQEVLTNTGSQSILGGLTATSFTGSLQGTASWAQNAVTSSYILQAVSSSFATTSSFAPLYVLNSQTESFVTNTQTSSFVQNNQTSSFVLNSQTSSMTVATASFATSSLSASFASTASFAPNYVLTSATSSMLAPYLLVSQTSSFVQNSQTSSFVLNSQTSSMTVASASQAATASSADNFTVRGTLTAQTIVAQTITSSTDFVTGSTRFGSIITNTHQFTGSMSITGSLSVASNELLVQFTGVTIGNIITDRHTITGSLAVSGSITGSLFGTSSWATNVVNAPNPFPYTGSAIITGSIVITGSAYGNVPAITVASNTASFDIRSGNFFTVTMGASSTTHFNVTNPSPGQTVSILVRTNTASTASFSSNVRQVTGSLYTPSVSGSNDILTFITFDSTNVFMTSLKRLA